MSWNLVTTPNGKQYKAKDKSYYLLHVTNKWRDSYSCFNPEPYTSERGKVRYRIQLPVLLSIMSSENNEVLMDLPDILRCYDVPCSPSCYKDVQLFLNGEEAVHPYGPKRSTDSDQYAIIQDSWYLLHIRKEYIDEYDDLDPVEYRLGDGRVRYKARLPMLCKIPSGGSPESNVDIKDVCKYFNVPCYLYESFDMFLDGCIAEHPSSKISKSSHKLPCGEYYVGDPLYLQDSVETAYDKFFAHNGLDRMFIYRKEKVITISTRGDDSYPLYETTETPKLKDTTARPRHVDSIITETATICFIPLNLLYGMGFRLPKIKREGFIFNSMNISELSNKKTFSVVINYRGGLPQYVDFLNYAILICDKNKFDN